MILEMEPHTTGVSINFWLPSEGSHYEATDENPSAGEAMLGTWFGQSPTV